MKQILDACDRWDSAEPGSAEQQSAAAEVVALVQSALCTGRASDPARSEAMRLMRLSLTELRTLYTDDIPPGERHLAAVALAGTEGIRPMTKEETVAAILRRRDRDRRRR